MSPNKFIAVATILIICFASTARTSPFYGHEEDKIYKEEEHITEKVTEKPCGLVCKLDHTKDKVINATKSAINSTKEAIKSAGKKVQDIYNQKVEEHNARHHHKKEEQPIQYGKSDVEYDYNPKKPTSYGKTDKESPKTDGYGKSDTAFALGKADQAVNNAHATFDQGLSKAQSGLNQAFDSSQSTFNQGLSKAQSGLNQAFDSSQSTFNQAANNAASGLPSGFPNTGTVFGSNVEPGFQSGGGSGSGTGFGQGSSSPSSGGSGYASGGSYSGGTVFNPVIPAGNSDSASSTFNQQPGTLQGGGIEPAIPVFGNTDQNADSGFQSGIGQRGGSIADKTKELLEKEKHSSSY